MFGDLVVEVLEQVGLGRIEDIVANLVDASARATKALEAWPSKGAKAL